MTEDLLSILCKRSAAGKCSAQAIRVGGGFRITRALPTATHDSANWQENCENLLGGIMAVNREELLDCLNDIETCRDTEKGFQTAAEHINDPVLKKLFNEYSVQRAQFASELESEVWKRPPRSTKRNEEQSV